MNQTTIYIVDDDSSARKGLSNLLNAAGYKVEAFSSIDDFYQLQPIDIHACLIIDAWVPGLSEAGLQAAISKKNAPLSVIFLSARNDVLSREKAIKANAAGYFRKPIDGPALLDALAWEIEATKRDIALSKRK